MKSLKSKLSKFAVFAFIGAFSFGLSISCVNTHNKESIKVSAEESDGTWTLSNGSLSFQYTDWQTNGYVTQTNQTMVHGNGDGTFDIGYELLGSPPGATTAGTELIAEKTIQLTGGYWTPSETGGYGTVSGYPVDVNGLDSGEMITLNINVQYSGNMNEQNSGAGTTEPDGTWTLSNGSLSFQYTDWQTNGYVTQTNQTMVYGHGDGTFDISYELLGSPPGATTAGTELIAEKTIQLTRGYWTPGDTGYGTVSGYPVDVNGLDSGEMITLNINVQYSGNMNEQGSGEGDDENAGTWTWNENTQKLSFQFNDTATAGYVSTTSQTMVYGLGNGSFDIGYDLWGTQANATMAGNDLLSSKTIRIYDGYYDEDQSTVTGNPSAISGLESYGQITIKVDVDTSGTMTSDGWRVNDGNLYFYVLADVNPASIDSITWNNSSGNGTGEAILSVTISTNGGSFQQVYQINNPTFNPELEGTSGTTLGNTTVEGISEWSDRYVTIDISNKSYSLGESTQETRYTITYYPNGADGEPANDSTEPVLEGEVSEYMLLHNMFERPNYIFLGWSEDSSSQTPSYEEGEKVYLRSDISYYAVWEYQEPDYYTLDICFDPNNGDEFINRVAEGETLPLSYEISDDITPTYEGHSFLGWYYDGNLYLPGEVIRDIYENITLVAQWEEVSSDYSYSVIFNGNGATSGTMDTDTFTSSEYSYDYSLPPCRFEREGYEFSGWSLSEEGLIKFQPGETRNITNGETIFFAIWAEQFTITFEANGGSGYMEPITVASGERRTVPGCDFTREGYSFVCWAVNSPTSSMTVNPDDNVTVNQNYVLYAVWEQDGPVQHEGMWYDEESNRLRFYNTDLGGEQEVKLEVTVLDFGPNTSSTRAEISAIIYYEDSIWETRSYDMRTFTVGDDSGRQFISGQLDLQDGEGQRAVKLYVETLYNNVMTPGLNYVEGYNQIFYVNDQYDSSVVEFENVEINEITREATLEGYAVDVSGETDMHEFTITLTNASVNVDEMYGDGQILTGYWPEIKKTITLTVFNITYNSLEEEPITPETIEEINNGMDKVDLSNEQKQQINDKIDENSDRIGESTGNAISQALDGTAGLMSDNPEFAEKQKEVIVVVVETVIEVETNKGSDIGQGKKVDANLPDNADLNVENEIREFYERQMQELLGGEKQTRGITRALTPSYKIDVDISGIEDDKVIGHLDNEIASYGKMMNFIDSSVSHMSEAALKIRQCSGESVKISVKNYVTTVKVSSFREFDKEAADAEFLENVYKAIMLHMQEQVINTLESEHKDSGNKEKEEVYQNELAAVKDYETFEIMVTEVLRQKYVALTGDETYTQENLENFFNDVYWPIFRAWALDEDIPQELKDKGINITLEQLTTTTIEQSTSRAKAFTIHSDLQNNEIIFLAAFGGGVVLTISLAAIIPTIINKRRRGLVK